MAMFVKRARSCCCCYDGDADREDGSVSPLWLQSLVGEQKRDETKAARSHGLSVPPTSWPAIRVMPNEICLTDRWFQMVVVNYLTATRLCI